MKKIVAFGDSFVQLTHGFGVNWVTLLANRMSLPIVNYGYYGSALGYSLHKFFEYQASDEFDPEDIIIFVTTNQNRIMTHDLPSPKFGVLQFQIGMKGLCETKAELDWLTENGEHGLWAMEKIYHSSINYEIQKTASTIRVWADANPTNLVILIRGSDDDSRFEGLARNFTNSIQSTNNFISLTDNIGLFSASSYEFGTDEKSAMEVSIRFIWARKERRVNHFSPDNLEKLTQMVFDVIVHRNKDYYDLCKLQRHFLLD